MALTGEDVRGRRVVVFDFDGTLADTLPTIVATARTVLLAHGLAEGDLGDLSRLVGPPFPQAFSMVYGVSDEEAERITEDYRAIYNHRGLEAWPFFDGIRELLVSLRAVGRLTATASSKNVRTLMLGVEDNDAVGLFDVVEGKRADRGDSKAASIRRALEALGAAPAEAVMVGDRRFDVEAAREVGLPCVGVTYGHTCDPAELVDAGACALAESVDELGRVLLGT